MPGSTNWSTFWLVVIFVGLVVVGAAIDPSLLWSSMPGTTRGDVRSFFGFGRDETHAAATASQQLDGNSETLNPTLLNPVPLSVDQRITIFIEDWYERCRIDKYCHAHYPVDPYASVALQDQQWAENEEAWERMYAAFEARICRQYGISEDAFLAIVTEGYDEGWHETLSPCP